MPFDGGIVRYNFAEDRLQILFNEIPDKEFRTKMHNQYRFNWSRQFGAWQRQLTSNAKYAAQQILNVAM